MRCAWDDDAIEIGEDRLKGLALLRSGFRKLRRDFAWANAGQDGMLLRVREVRVDPLADPCKVFFKG